MLCQASYYRQVLLQVLSSDALFTPGVDRVGLPLRAGLLSYFRHVMHVDDGMLLVPQESQNRGAARLAIGEQIRVMVNNVMLLLEDSAYGFTLFLRLLFFLGLGLRGATLRLVANRVD